MNTLEQPTTEELQTQHGITPETELQVIEARNRLGYAIGRHQEHYVSVDGSCALTNQPQLVSDEARVKANAGVGLENYIGLNRSLCFFKPRSDPAAWSGLDTTERAAGYAIIAAQASRYANGAAEIGSAEQLRRYGSMLTLGWVGGRAVDNTELIRHIALNDRRLPLGVKNSLDGTIEAALRQVALVEELRSNEDAPAILIYRGGANAKTAKASKEMCKRVIEATKGRVIIDTAHGLEMAHDQAGKFEKSPQGQILATQMLLELDREGYHSLGKMSEASAQTSPTDPHMPLAIALNASRKLYQMKRNSLLVPVRQRQSRLY